MVNVDKSIFSIIGDRYLDTQHTKVYIESLEAELKKRGITGIYRWFLEYIAASSLWWNVVWWEWCDLNGKDIIIGWIQNIVLFGFLALITTVVFGFFAGIITFLVLHILTTWLGFDLRSGTKLT